MLAAIFTALFVLVLILTAKAKRKTCTWNWRMTSRRLIWGILAIVAVQIGGWLVLMSSGHSIGLLGVIQWIGIYWVALAIFRRHDLRVQTAQSEHLLCSNTVPNGSSGVPSGAKPLVQKPPQSVANTKQMRLSYRWGAFQGWCTAVLGVVLVVVAPWLHRPELLLLGLFWSLMGWGLQAKRRYGFVLFYVAMALILLMGTLKMDSQIRVAHLALLLFWGVPAAFYYPKRWSESV